MIRVVRLISGEQIVSQIKEKEDKKDFLYLVDPLKMEIVPKLSKEFLDISFRNKRASCP